MRLSGTYHPLPYLLERLPLYLPGISTVYAVWMDYDKNIYTSLENKPITDTQKQKIQEVRTTPKNAEWRATSELFATDKLQNGQLSLDDENTMNSLHIYFPSPVDRLKDILIIEFPQTVYLKRLDNTFNGITTDEKHLLRNLLQGILLAEHQRVIEEREFLKQLEMLQKRNTTKINSLTTALKSTEMLYSSSIRTIVEEHKSTLETTLNKSIILSDEVIFQLAKAQLSIKKVKEAISQAIHLAFAVNISSPTIHITPDHLQLEKVKENINASPSSDRSQKIKILLDTYEDAGLRLQSKGIAINGKNLAAALQPPVTPPAITDAVKKNKTKIAYFLTQYPQKWPLIRKYIRPINHIDEMDSLRNTGS